MLHLRLCQSSAVPGAGARERPHADSWVVQQGEVCVIVPCTECATLLPPVLWSVGAHTYISLLRLTLDMQVVTIVDQLCLANMSEGGGHSETDIMTPVRIAMGLQRTPACVK